MAAGEKSDEDLKTTLALARKKPLAFGLCLGKKSDTTVLMTHKTKAPSLLGQQARKAGETGKFTFGLMSVSGKNLELTCEGDIPAGAGRKVKEYLKSAGFAMRVLLLDTAGNQVEGDGDEDDDTTGADAAGAQDGADTEGEGDAGPDPRAAEWEQRAEHLTAALDQATDAPPQVIEGLRLRLQALAKLATDGAYDEALAGVGAIDDALKEAVAAGRQAAQRAVDQQQHWEEARDKLAPIVEQALAAGVGNIRKIEALWTFAKSKAEAAVPDHGAAIKTITMLVKLIEEARLAAPAAEAPQAAAAGAGSGAEVAQEVEAVGAGGAAPRGPMAGQEAPPAPVAAGGSGPAAGPAEPAAAPPPGPAGPAAPPPEAAAPPPPEGASAAVATAPEPTAPADLAGSAADRIARARTRLGAVDGLITDYLAILPGSAETTPPDWTSERRRIGDEIDAQEAATAAADDAKINTALQDIVELEKKVRAATALKKDWKAALDLFALRLVPLDQHAQAGAVPQIKPKIDAIKADLATAEADAASRDFAKAMRALGPLGIRCDEVLALADAFAEYSTVFAQRSTLVTPLVGTAPTGVVPIDTATTELVTLFTDAQADAATDKYADAVAKLDRIPPLADRRDGLVQHEADYVAWHGEVLANRAAIDGYAADVLAPLLSEITIWKAAIGPAEVTATGDYFRSVGLMTDLAVQSRRIISDCDLHVIYLGKLATFQADLAALEAHPGRAGIEEFILSMQNDLTQAEVDALALRLVTATALLDHTTPQIPAQQAIADQCELYTARRDALHTTIDGMRGRAGTDEGLAQADALMATAANQALAKDFATAMTTLGEADTRVQEATAAADAQDALGGLKDDAALDALATDFEAAYKVFDDMRAQVVAADDTSAFTALIAEADTPAAAARAEAAKPAPDFAVARASLDGAIAALERTMATIHAAKPFRRSLADVRTMQNTTLPPLNIDDCIRQPIDDVTQLADEAEALAAPAGYDFAGGEAKLIEAMAIARKAQSNAALYPAIRTARTTIEASKTEIAGSTAAARMGHTTAVLDKILADIQTALDAGDFAMAERKALTGAAMQAAVTADIDTCNVYAVTLKDWYIDPLTTLTSAEAQPEVVKATAMVAEAEAAIAAGNYSGGLATLDMIGWAIDRAILAQTDGAAYTAARTGAELKLTVLRALDSPPLAERIAAIGARFAEAEALVAATPPNYIGGARKMTEISAECDAVSALVAASRIYESARIAAEAARTAIEGHAQAEAIRPAIDRLAAKYDSAVGMATTDDFAPAQAMMEEVRIAAEEAGTAADHAAIFDGIAEAVGGMGDASGPDFGQITAAKTVLLYLQSRDDAVIAATDLDLAADRIAFAEVGGNPPAERTQALRDAMDATRRAETVLVQHRELMRAIETARARIDSSLGAHAQAAYVATDVATLKADLDAIILLVSSGTEFDKATADLNTVMERYAEVLADADGQVEFLALRVSPELDARLDALVAHAHSYAIRSNIDTMRAKIAQADDLAVARDHDAALTALNDAIRIGASALVMADMRGNVPPTVDAIKAIMNGPGGLDELDAMVDQLEPDAQRAVIRVAFEARFGCSLENWQGGSVVADGAQTGPDIKKFYEIMADLPMGATLDNDSFRVFRNEESGGGGSRYNTVDKAIIMDEGSSATSSPTVLGTESEVGAVEPGCEPADDAPVTRFSWNTLHEVGHAVDDQQGFMDARQSGPAYGGWQVHGRNTQGVAVALAGHYDYDAAYIGQLLAGATPALPDMPTGVDPQEWESRRLRVEAHIAAARVGVEPWGSMAAATRLAINGRVYQESYANDWTSYELAARSRGISAYQFRAPGEWFAELYAAYHSAKLKDSHPAAGWLATL